MLQVSGGDIAKIEDIMGIPTGLWQKQTMIVIDVNNPVKLNLRMATGNEMGANELWLPGGKLPGGMNEAVIDQINKDNYIIRIIE